MVDWLVRLGQEVLENFAVNIGDGWVKQLVNVTIWPLMIITGLGLRGAVGRTGKISKLVKGACGKQSKPLEAINKQDREERLNGRRLICTSRGKSLKKEAHVTVWVTRSGRKDDEEQMDGISLVVMEGSSSLMVGSADQMKMGYISRANLRDASRHVILGHQQYELKDFAYQINSLLMEDPNKPMRQLANSHGPDQSLVPSTRVWIGLMAKGKMRSGIEVGSVIGLERNCTCL
ncbi:hypothetical protein PPACK8108_LOCUS23284 [Phakopsora pachyrhizi]|uniref:Uncharacterized protein n=1 Tax=Phakopsora pachyrhizi TaxID=170000 RepID=A0AAV0BPP1_PHAPC|nr:hypothetical protein PPACK8108_LOCUS23284 [Phakopsora pachyrhizi]